MNLNSGFVRVLAILAFAVAICWSSQAAEPSSTGGGRLVVQRSPAFGKEYLRLSIDGKVHNIGPGSRYDQPISAGHHVLTVDAPRNQHPATPMSLTVDPGQTYAFTATRDSHQGVSLLRSSRTP